VDHAAALRAAARLGPVLELACGEGRHALAAAALGIPCIAMDRSPEALALLGRTSSERGLPVHPVRADLETPHGIPARAGCFGAVLVFRFLHRPLAPAIAAALAPGGLLLYETFTFRQKELGYGPSNPAFLLDEGELPGLFPELEVLRYEEGLREAPRPRHLASLAARKPAGP
jgi:SAM-dependent methyltransferase